jgi:hypothetical protein
VQTEREGENESLLFVFCEERVQQTLGACLLYIEVEN